MTRVEQPPNGRVSLHPRQGRPTTADVARLAGVSTKTVSRVLTGEVNVSPRTRGKVLAAVGSLRFRPNGLARDLRTGGASSTVGFVIGELSNPFYAAVAAGVESALAAEGLTLLLAATEDRSRQEAHVVEALLERRVRALLLVPTSADHSYLQVERQLGTPVVAVDRPLIDAVSDSVVFANREGAHDGTTVLLRAGHRRIAFVGSAPSLYTHGERLRGYREALTAYGLAPDPELERMNAPDITTAGRMTESLLSLSSPPEAIMAGNNRAAIGVLEVLRERGAQLGFVAFDDFELARTLGISVVAHDDRAMGQAAARIAMSRMRGQQGLSEQVVLPTSVVLRRSHTQEGVR